MQLQCINFVTQLQLVLITMIKITTLCYMQILYILQLYMSMHVQVK